MISGLLPKLVKFVLK